MRQVEVIYHVEPEGCWAESPDIPGFSAAGDSLDEVRQLTRDGLAAHLGGPVDILERFSGEPDDPHGADKLPGLAVTSSTWGKTEYLRIATGGQMVTTATNKSTLEFTQL